MQMKCHRNPVVATIHVSMKILSKGEAVGAIVPIASSPLVHALVSLGQTLYQISVPMNIRKLLPSVDPHSIVNRTEIDAESQEYDLKIKQSTCSLYLHCHGNTILMLHPLYCHGNTILMLHPLHCHGNTILMLHPLYCHGNTILMLHPLHCHGNTILMLHPLHCHGNYIDASPSALPWKHYIDALPGNKQWYQEWHTSCELLSLLPKC